MAVTAAHRPVVVTAAAAAAAAAAVVAVYSNSSLSMPGVLARFQVWGSCSFPCLGLLLFLSEFIL